MVVFQVVAGTIGFFLVLFGLLQPVSEFLQLDGRPGFYYGLFTTNAVYIDFIRNAGFYDEPGNLAFWGIFALILNKLFVGDKKTEYLLIFGLISTLSLAYFAQVIFYFFFFFKKQRLRLMIPAVFFLIFILGISSMSESLNSSLIGRFTYDENSIIVGNNRSELFERCWGIFKTSPIVGVGATNLATNISSKLGFVGGNFFTNFASDGIIGVFVSYLPLLFLLKLGQRKRQYRYTFVIILLGYFQRPYSDTQLLFPLTLYTILLFAYLDVNKYNLKVNKSIYNQ